MESKPVSTNRFTIFFKTLGWIKPWIKQNPKKSALMMIFSFSSMFAMLLIIKYQSSFLYFPNEGYGRYNHNNPYHLQHPKNRNLSSIDLQIQTQDGVFLKGWHIQKQRSERIIVYFHGNAGNIGSRLFYVQNLMNELNTDVIMVAYRGYSDSQQKNPTQNGLKLDSEAILEKAKKIAQQKKLPLYIMGTSLGGAVATYVAGTDSNKDKIAGLVLQNTFTSTTDVLRTLMSKALGPLVSLIGLINFNEWNSLMIINKVKAPILFIKGMKDNLVKPQLMEQLRKRCNDNHIKNYVLQIRQGSHNDTWYVDKNTYFAQIWQFFSSVEKGGRL